MQHIRRATSHWATEYRNILFQLSLTLAFAFFLSIKSIAGLTLNHSTNARLQHVRSARVTEYSPPALASSRTCSLSVNCSTSNVRESHSGWRRPICLRLQAISRKRATNYRALLRKMTYKHKASYGSSPPCTRIFSFHSFLLSISFFQSLSKLHGGKARHAGAPRDIAHMCAMSHMRDMTHFYGITRIYDLTHD